MSVNIINIEHLYYRYSNGNLILNDINISIADNEFVVIAGQNGCGKTTLLKNISGLLRPLQGNIFIKGQNIDKTDISVIADEIGFVMQDPDRQLFVSTVYDEVAFALRHKRFSENEIKNKTEEALEAVGLSDKRDDFPPALGRTDRVKTVFASVIAMGPKIIMLDEPTAGRDYAGCKLLMDITAGLHQKGYTVILVTHNMNIAAEYARRLIVMKAGRVCMDRSPGEIFAKPAELYDAGILPPQITRLSQSLQKHMPLEKLALSPAGLASALTGQG